MELKKAYFGGGCFWCVEAVFQRLKGVDQVVSGFTGGKIKNPTYREVCSGLTGHNEVIEISYDESLISFTDLLYVFFSTHDPTTLNRQGNDVGTQYRSGIYFTDEAQKLESERFIKEEASKIWDDSIVTEVVEFDEFYPAEDYHQNYYNENGNQGYCRIIIEPKVIKFKENFKHLLKDG